MIIDGVEYKQISYLPKYYVSNNGDIYSTKRNKILKQRTTRKGYKTVSIIGEDKVKHTVFVHRAVALAWIPNPDNKPQVHHKDEDKTNNNISNLAWVTDIENNNAGTRNSRISKTMGRPVVLTNIKDGSKLYFDSSREARRAGYVIDSYIAGITHHVKGYTAEYLKNGDLLYKEMKGN